MCCTYQTCSVLYPCQYFLLLTHKLWRHVHLLLYIIHPATGAIILRWLVLFHLQLNSHGIPLMCIMCTQRKTAIRIFVMLNKILTITFFQIKFESPLSLLQVCLVVVAEGWPAMVAVSTCSSKHLRGNPANLQAWRPTTDRIHILSDSSLSK